jgi:hypothetical protein
LIQNQVKPGIPQTPVIDPTTNRLSRPWMQYFLNFLNFNSAPTATAGQAILPAKPAGFMIVTVQGKQFKVPYYNN